MKPMLSSPIRNSNKNANDELHVEKQTFLTTVVRCFRHHVAQVDCIEPGGLSTFAFFQIVINLSG